MKSLFLLSITFFLVSHENAVAEDLSHFTNELLSKRQTVIDQRLKNKGLPVTKPFKDTLYVDTSCFSEDILKNPEELKVIKDQIAQTLLFLENLYVSGNGNSPASEISFCPILETARKSPLTQRSERFVVGVGKTVVSKDALEEAFQRGDHLDPKSPLKKYWYYANPYGEFQTLLKKEILSKGTDTLTRLE